MIVGIILLIGAVSITGLPLDLLPELNLPIAVVTADFPGAAPAEVESLLTRPLEEALSTVARVENMRSFSSPGGSVIIVEFDWGTDMDFSLLEAREKLDMARPFLPDEASSPRVMQADPNLFPVMQILVYGDKEPAELRETAQETVKSRLERVEGVAAVDVLGGLKEEIHVILDPIKLLPYGLSPGHLEQALKGGSLDLAAGPLKEEERERLVRTEGRLTSVEDIQALPLLPLPNGFLTVGEIAEVEMVEVAAGGISRYNKKPSVTIAVKKQSGANTVQVAAGVREALNNLEGELPAGIELRVVTDQSKFIREALLNVLQVGLFGGALAAIVLFLFLKSLASTFAVLLAIPVSIVATFILMFFSGITLNIISLGGLALGLGIMVDNSIVVLENIFRYRQEGLSEKEAAAKGTSQVTGALLAATLTTVIVFIPVLFLEGVVSQIFTPLSLTVSFALLTSLLASLTLVPLFASRFLKFKSREGQQPIKGKGGEGKLFNSFKNYYSRLLDKIIEKPWPLLAGILILLSTSLLFLPRIGSEFLPPVDEGIVNIHMELPLDTSLEATAVKAEEVEEFLFDIPGVENVKVAVGSGSEFGSDGFGNLGKNEARLEALLPPLSERDYTSREMADTIRDELRKFEEAKFKVEESRQASGGGFMETPVSILLRGRDLKVLEELTRKVEAVVIETSGTREVTSTFQQGRPEIIATVNREAALRRGVPPLEVALFLRTILQGSQVARAFTKEGERVIRLKIDPARIDSIAALERIPFIPASLPPGAALAEQEEVPVLSLRNTLPGGRPLNVTSPLSGGFPVQLGELASFEETGGPLAIRRANQMRASYVEAQISGRDAGSVTAEIKEELADLNLPEGYTLDFGGEQRLIEDSFADLKLALILSLFLVYMIMAAQFESLRQPFIIMFTLPQTLIGVIGGLLLSGRPFSVPAYIGIIMLGGIVVNNGIVMVDYMNKLREEGTQLKEAVVEGAKVRLRPILMTSLTTLLAMLPLALGLGSGGEIQAPLAVVVAGGLLTSTFLTIFVVPAVYYLLERRLDRA